MISAQMLNRGDPQTVKQFIYENNKSVYDMAFSRTGNVEAARAVSRSVLLQVANAAKEGRCRQPELLWLMELVNAECDASQRRAAEPPSAEDVLNQLNNTSAQHAQNASAQTYAPWQERPAQTEQPVQPAYTYAPRTPAEQPVQPAYTYAPRTPAEQPAQTYAQRTPNTPSRQRTQRAAVKRTAEPAQEESISDIFAEDEPAPRRKKAPREKHRDRQEVNDGLFLDEDDEPETALGGRRRRDAKKARTAAQTESWQDETDDELFAEDDEPAQHASGGTIALIIAMALVVALLIWMLLVMLMSRGIIPDFDMGFAEWFNNNLFKLY